MPTKDRSWFERKVRELADALRGLPPARQRDVVEALEEDREPGARQGTDRCHDSRTGESEPDR